MAYSKTTWVNGAAPGISAEKLNKIENGIANVEAESALKTTTISTSESITGGGDLSTNRSIGHSTAAGHKHIPPGGVEGQLLGYSAIGTATWETIPTPSWEKISTTVLSADAYEVSVSVPSGYRFLRITLSLFCNGSGDASLYGKFNSFSGSHYFNTTEIGSGTTTYTTSSSNYSIPGVVRDDSDNKNVYEITYDLTGGEIGYWGIGKIFASNVGVFAGFDNILAATSLTALTYTADYDFKAGCEFVLEGVK